MFFAELPGWLRFATLAGFLVLLALFASTELTGSSDERLSTADALETVRQSFIDATRIDDLTCVARDETAFRCSFRFGGERCSAIVSDSDGFQLDLCERHRPRNVDTRSILLEDSAGAPDRTQVGSPVEAQRLCDEMQDGEYDQLLDRQKRIQIYWPASGDSEITCVLRRQR